MMKKSKFTESQIAFALKQAEVGLAQFKCVVANLTLPNRALEDVIEKKL